VYNRRKATTLMKIFKQSIRRENKFIKVDALTAELKTYNKVSGILSV